MKFTCPSCRQKGIPLRTFLFDDIGKKKNQCELCQSGVTRRHYESHLVIQALCNGFILSIPFFWFMTGIYGLIVSSSSLLAVIVLSRLSELIFHRLETVGSDR